VLDSSAFLEQALLEEGVITTGDLDECRLLAAEVQCSVCEAMVTLGKVDGRTIALTKAYICEAPFVDLDHFEINFENARFLPKALAEKDVVFPLFVMRGVVTLGTDDPLNLSVMDDVRQILKREIEPVQCESSALKKVIASAYGLGLGSVAEDAESSGVKSHATAKDDGTERGPIIDAVNTILVDAIRCGASDVHLNPDQTILHIRFRIDGRLQPRQGPSLNMYSKIVQRLKVMAHLDLTQSRRPQDGKFRFEHENQTIDVRLSILPTVDGENVVMRLLFGQGRVARFDQLGMSDEVSRQLQEIIRQPYGMLLATGPTGSGKTTTLYSILDKINTPDRNILTIEDPVEIRMPMIRQIQVNHEIGLTFASALRSILRQDPDIIFVGEIRDAETAEIALQSALTGHFVLSTLHTNDSAGAVARLLDLGQPAFVINSAVLGVIAQRLVRRTCEHCAAVDHPDATLLSLVGLSDDRGMRKGRGCPHCLQTGYQGRTGIYELLSMSPPLKNAIAHGASTEEIRQISMQEGAYLMWRDGIDKARLGQTTLDEVLRAVPVDEIQRQSATLAQGARTTNGNARRSDSKGAQAA